MSITHPLLLAAVFAAPIPAQCQNLWTGGYGCPGVGGSVAALSSWDPDGPGPLGEQLVAAGDFLVAGDVACERLVRWDPATSAWTAVPAPPLPYVSAMATLPTGELVAACHTSVYAPTPIVAQVATWNGAAWTVLGGSFDEMVYDLEVRPGGALLAAGGFTSIAGSATGGLAVWNGASWAPFAGGVAGQVVALASLPNGDLAITGTFAAAGGVPAANVARYDGTAWSAYGGGLTSFGSALAALPTGGLFVGTAAGLWAWDGAQWATVPGLTTSTPLPPQVTALLGRANGTLVVAGWFSAAGGQPTSRIAVYTPATLTWTTLGTGVGQASFGQVASMVTLPSGDLVVGGYFTRAGALDVHGIARHDGASWRALHDGLPFGVRCAAALDDTRFVVAGRFGTIGNLPCGSVALWNGAAWQPLGSGLSFASTFDAANDAILLPNGDLLVAGTMTGAGGAAVQGLARWDGVAWSSFGGGLALAGGPGAATRVVRLPSGDIVVGGWFSSAGGVAANNIARWNGASWSPLGAGVGGFVTDLALGPDGELFVLAGDDVLTWNGSIWTTVASYGGNDVPVSIAPLRGGALVVGGYTTMFFGTSTRGFVDEWLAGGALFLRTQTNFDSRVHAMHRLPDGDVLVSGQFSDFGGVPAANQVRLIDPPFAGIDASLPGAFVDDFEVLPGGDLLAVGGASALGGTPTWLVARLTTTCPGSAVAAGTGCTGSGGANVLTAAAPPWIGATFASVAVGMPPLGLALGVRGLGTAAVPLASILPQGQPGCDLLVTPDLLDVYVAAAGAVTTSFAIPDAIALAGQVLHQQVVPIELDALGNFVAFTSTNRLTLTIGSF